MAVGAAVAALTALLTLAWAARGSGPGRQPAGEGVRRLAFRSVIHRSDGPWSLGLCRPPGSTNRIGVYFRARLDRGGWTRAGFVRLPDGVDETEWPLPSSLQAGDSGVFALVDEGEDADGNGLPDGWEALQRLPPEEASGPMDDVDGDGYPALYEWAHGTDPLDPTSRPEPTLYVDAAAPAPGNGRRESPFPTFQAALDAAGDLDIVEAADGIYRGEGNRQVDFRGKRVMVRSAGGADRCVLDAEANGPVVYFGGGEGPEAMLCGVTARGGWWPCGGGVLCEFGSAPSLVGCVLTGNGACYGGGLSCLGGAHPILINCLVAGNEAQANGGIDAWESWVTLEHCTVAANRADALEAGGIGSDGALRIRNTIVWGNSGAQIAAPGGVLESCLVQGGWPGGTGVLDADPQLSPFGWRVTAGSPCLGRAAGRQIRFDRDGEVRDRPADIGADEFVDADGDSLADAWERDCFGDLSRDGTADADGDGVTDAAEGRRGTDPRMRDTDGDGVDDGAESAAGTDPLRADTDGDGWQDGIERALGTDPLRAACHPAMAAGQASYTGIHTGRVWVVAVAGGSTGVAVSAGTEGAWSLPVVTNDAVAIRAWVDVDGDGVWDYWEPSDEALWVGPEAGAPSPGLPLVLNDSVEDRDGDGLADGWERHYFGDIESRSGGEDDDEDGLSTLAEAAAGTSPTLPDKDGDGLPDGLEAVIGTSPLMPDTDGDGFTDDWEFYLGSDPKDPTSIPLGGPGPDWTWIPFEGEWLVDVDVDSDNDQGCETPSRSDGEDAVEASSPGKVVIAADGDSDGDRIPDFADGYDLLPAVKLDNASAGSLFVPIVFEIDKLLDLGRTRVTVAYEASPPQDTVFAAPYSWTSAPGVMRLWSRPAEAPRRGRPLLQGGSFIPPGEYAAFDFGFRGAHCVTNYIEVVRTGRVTVVFTVDPNPWGSGIPAMRPRRDLVTLTSVRVGLLTDMNRDLHIDDEDRVTRPFRFWVNDDRDVNPVSGTDRPVAPTIGGDPRNFADAFVNSVRDLVDFFPVWADLGDLLREIPPETLEVRLLDSGADLQWVPTDIPADKAGAYLTDASLAEPLGWAFVHPIPDGSSGWLFPESVKAAIRDGTQGVFLMEARKPNATPLVLQVRAKSTGALLLRRPLALSVSGVESMFRHRNLRPATGGAVSWPTRAGNPPNWPDGEVGDRDFVVVHGFMCGEDDAREIHCEVFKRMFWSGSRARFHGVTWQSDAHGGKPLCSLAFPFNERNAFEAASSFAAYVGSLPGPVSVMAHSLGTVLVSAAVQDHGLRPEHYFMVSGSAPAEAYDGSMSTNSWELTHPDWLAYEPRLWASEWHELFPVEDGRRRLTWRERFPEAARLAVNYYADSDEVLELKHEPVPAMIEDGLLFIFKDKRRYSWWKKEILKGRTSFGSSSYGGWEFSSLSEYVVAGSPLLPTEAALIGSPALRGAPFFDNGIGGGVAGIDELYSASVGAGTPGSACATAARNALLADMFPALSRPAGGIEVESMEIGGSRNTDMRTLTSGWPGIPWRDHDKWLHCDYKLVAYTYVHGLFDSIVVRGALE